MSAEEQNTLYSLEMWRASVRKKIRTLRRLQDEARDNVDRLEKSVEVAYQKRREQLIAGKEG
jgi:hypothetical protein